MDIYLDPSSAVPFTLSLHQAKSLAVTVKKTLTAGTSTFIFHLPNSPQGLFSVLGPKTHPTYTLPN